MKKVENLGHQELVARMRALNNTTGIQPIEIGPQGEKAILTLVDPATLKYPEGYYWNSKYGVTNKHNTASGHYEAFHLYCLKKVQ